MKEALNFKPGDVIRVNLNPIKGHEQKGVRPAIVITHLYQFGLIVIVPLTTKDKGWWTQVKISKREDGLTKDSFTESKARKPPTLVVGMFNPMSSKKGERFYFHI